jgi:4-oxalocrotonate tautomerase
MPLVRIDLRRGTTDEYRTTLGDVVYTALTTVANVPTGDRFIVVTEHDPANLQIDPHYFVERTDQALIIQITFNQGRTNEVKKALYRAIAEGLHERLGIRTEDVMITLVDVPKENWSFGLGDMQYGD